MLLVTGGAGFIGSHFVGRWLGHGGSVVNLDKLTYAGNRANLAALQGRAGHVFVQGDIGDRALLDQLLARYQPRAIVHLAAESHVDRAIAASGEFVSTNIAGTWQLLEAARAYWCGLPQPAQRGFRLLLVSTDEVYGSLAPGRAPSTESDRYRPRNPYSASKAAADHLALAWFHTYGLPVLLTHGSNSYGPRQHEEKLIPHMLSQALAGRRLPIYGDGQQVRDWLHVADHCRALIRVLAAGVPGQSYNVGGGCPRTNLVVVRRICAGLDRLRPRADGHSYAGQIAHVADRPGHDRRYALDTSKIRRELGWTPRWSFEDGLAQTLRWYLEQAPGGATRPGEPVGRDAPSVSA